MVAQAAVLAKALLKPVFGTELLNCFRSGAPCDHGAILAWPPHGWNTPARVDTGNLGILIEGRGRGPLRAAPARRA